MSSDNRDEDHFNRSFWQNSTSYDGSSKILLATIVSFSIIILIVFAYHLYSRFVMYHPRPAFQGLSVVSQPPIRGLDKLVIASLPTFVVGVNSGNISTTECAVCLSLLEEKDTVRMLPNCKHVFHMTCIDTWLTSCSTCPICRTEVEPSQRLVPEPREGPNGDAASPLDFTAASSSNDKTGMSPFRTNDHSKVDRDRVLDLERQ